MSIGKRIFDKRRELEMSQEELGRRVGVTKGAVSAWESGATELSMRRANDVARALDMNIIQLMHGITSTATDSTQIDGGSIVPRVRMGGLEFLNPDWRGPEKTPLSAIKIVGVMTEHASPRSRR